MKVASHRLVMNQAETDVTACLFGLGLAGLAGTSLFGLSSLAPFDTAIGILVMVIVTLIVIPAVCLWKWRCQICTRKRLLRCCRFASLGFFLPVHVAAGVSLFCGAVEFALLAAVLHLVILVIWLGLAATLWPAITWLGPFRIQDGESCPQCGYCVRGVASRICPECGRPFTESDLGLSVPEFEALVAGEKHPSASVRVV